jgi:uncharacterized protein (TIGR02145 family)
MKHTTTPKYILSAVLICFYCLLLGTKAHAQAPDGINYQAVIRNLSGTLVANTTIAIRIQIKQTSASGTIVFQERHSVTTSAQGVVNLVIGQGTLLGGNFSTINWATGPYFVGLGVSFTNGTNYLDYGYQQLMSVPYALYAKNAGNQLNQWRYGTTVPAAALGTLGDFYLNMTNGNVYYKSNATTWTLTGNITGPAGATGATGAQGIQGVPGPSGAAGTNGAQGIQGAPGVPGPQGIQGLPGAIGAAGSNGLNGQNALVKTTLENAGANCTNGGIKVESGLDANNNGILDPAEVNALLTTYVCNGLTGPSGAQGIQGLPGATGPAGAQGIQGVAGPTGPIGLTGPAGTNGAVGATGPAGAQGIQGLPGTNGTNGAVGATGPAGANGNGFSNGTAVNQLMYWNGSAWVTLNPGINGQVLSICNGSLTWVSMAGVCTLPAALTTLNCVGATTTGTLTNGTAASGVSTAIPYTGGNAGTYAAQSVSSTGVVGLTATLAAGTLANGAGSLTYTITGTPTTSGTASFAITVGGQSCSFTVSVGAAQPQYPAGTVNCAGATTVIDVTNPTTGKIWMDRNLGATQVATSSTDVASYGDLYQWGRRADGHQCRTSPTTASLSSIDQPANGNFILAPNAPNDWRSPQNINLWQGVNGVNNPCPSGYRIPTETEINDERLSWSAGTSVGAFASPLKLPMAGTRDYSTAALGGVGVGGYYWSSTVSGVDSRYLYFGSNATMSSYIRANGFTVRCIKDASAIPAAVGAINCGGATLTGNLYNGSVANGVSASVPYTAGNGGSYSSQSVSSTGVVGLTATLAAGTLANGAGSLTYTITGTPTSSGTASFAISLGGQSCTFTINVGVQGFTIGSGTSSTNWPTENFGGANRCNRSATIYPKAVLNQAGGFSALGNQLITSVKWQASVAGLSDGNIKIYMENTAATTTTTSQDWSTTIINNSILVYNGPISFNKVVGSWYGVTLTTPFTWNNVDNLKISVEYSSGTNFNNRSWYRTQGTGNTAESANFSGTCPSPLSNGSNSWYPNVLFNN